MYRLILLLGFSLGTVWLVRECRNSGSITDFQTDLIRLDTAAVQRIVIDPPGNRTAPFLLRRSPGRWIGQQSGTVTELMPVSVETALAALVQVGTDSIFQERRRQKLALNESNSTQIRVQTSDAARAEAFFLHRRDSALLFSFAGEPEIYVLREPHPSALLRPFLVYRNRELFREPPHRVHHVSLTRDDQSWVWSRDGERTWKLYGTQPARHDAVTLYLMDLQETRVQEFADDFSESDARLVADVVLKGAFATPVRLRYFREMLSDSTGRTVLHLNNRPNDYFYVESPNWNRLVAPVPSE